MSLSKTIEELFRQRGDSEYGGEIVTQKEHALQCATLAMEADSPTTLVVAALLHDVGHLLHELPDDAPDQGVDDHHENSGYAFLRTHFPPEVCEPVRLHVAAKRYLCTVEPSYREQLSEPSLVSLQLQGGEMSAEEVREFESSPHYPHAVQLRKWDDLAKIEGMPTEDVTDFLPIIDQVASVHGQVSH